MATYAPVIISFESSPIIASAKTDIFINQDSINCPITSCILKSPNCLETNIGTQISISSANNFEITLFNSSIPAGQNLEVCIECTNNI